MLSVWIARVRVRVRVLKLLEMVVLSCLILFGFVVEFVSNWGFGLRLGF